MKKVFFILLPLVFLFSSCVEIVEEITVNADQSGTASLHMDLGTFGSLATSLGGKYFQGNMLDQLKKLPETAAGILKNINGLTNVVPITDKKGLYSVSFNFKNAKQLNAALYKLLGIKKPFFAPNYMRLNKRKLVKKNYAPDLRLFIKKYKDQLKDAEFLKLITYKTIFHFPREVTHFSNKKSTLSTDKKTLEFKCTLDELLTSGTNIGNKVRY